MSSQIRPQPNHPPIDRLFARVRTALGNHRPYLLALLSEAPTIVPFRSLHSFAVVSIQPFPWHPFCPAQALVALMQEPLPLHELHPEHFTFASSGQIGFWEPAAPEPLLLTSFWMLGPLTEEVSFWSLAARMPERQAAPSVTESSTLRFFMMFMLYSVDN